MNKDEINQMLAEDIMGWRPIGNGRFSANGYPFEEGVSGEISSFNPMEIRKDAMMLVDKIDLIGGTLADVFYASYDGFDLKPVKPGQPIEMARVNPHEITLAAIKAHGLAKKTGQI